MPLFSDRREAGQELAGLLEFLKSEEPIVLGLAPSGVVLADVVASALEAPVDLLLIERLKAPKPPHHIVGAVDEHGRISMIKTTARWHHLTSQQMVEPAREAFRSLQRRRGRLRSVLPELDVRGRTLILVSQGVATGAKMLGAVQSVRDRGARKVIVACPAGSGEAAWQLHDNADLVVMPHRPASFSQVEKFYRDAPLVTDDIVDAIVDKWAQRRKLCPTSIETLALKLDNQAGQMLSCEIDLPPGTKRGSGPYPTVVLAHGLDSDARNRRSVAVGRRLAERGLIAVRFDFTGHGRSEGKPGEATRARMAADISSVLESAMLLHEVDDARIGLGGAGSSAQLALDHARKDRRIRAVVVRGPMRGREIEIADEVPVPTLFIWAEHDPEVSARHREQAARLPSRHGFIQIPDASRLFRDAISHEMMVGATAAWFADHLTPAHG